MFGMSSILPVTVPPAFRTASTAASIEATPMVLIVCWPGSWRSEMAPLMPRSPSPVSASQYLMPPSIWWIFQPNADS